MIIESPIKVKNYKCFGEQAQGFERILPINIIIGRNNSGKSSLLDLINYTITPNPIFLNKGRTGQTAEVEISDILSPNIIEKVFPRSTSGGGLPGPSHYQYGLTLANTKITYTLSSDGKKNIIHWEKPIDKNAQNYVQKLQNIIEVPLNKKNLEELVQKET